MRYCALDEGDEQRYNVVTVETVGAGPLPESGRRFPVSAACGICGTATIDDLHRRCRALPAGPRLEAGTLLSLPQRLSDGQAVFARTGGLHGAGLFDGRGNPLVVREDIGRHNAVDKLVGWAAMSSRLPLHDAVLVVSGRVSFEIVQKAAVAGICILVAVSAPSSLAVDTARQLGMTLAGFVRDGRANLYSMPDRVVSTAPAREPTGSSR